MRQMLYVGLGGLSAAAVVMCLLVLIGDHVLVLSRAPAATSRITDLEKQVKTDAAMAPQLEEERKRQTEASLAREARNQRLAWVLLVAAGVGVACGKGYISLRPQQLPARADLVAVRFAVATPAGGKRSPAPATQHAAGLPAAEGIDLSFVDDLVARVGRSREAGIVILQAIQNHYRYLPDEALKRVCELTEILPAQVAGTSSFYAQFRRSPVGRHVVRVCHGTACHVAGIEQIHEEMRRHLGLAAGEDTDARRLFTLDKVACLGCCSLAPVMMIEEETAGHLTPVSARQALDRLAPSS